MRKTNFDEPVVAIRNAKRSAKGEKASSEISNKGVTSLLRIFSFED